jgi:hypothetical protein
VTPAGPSSQRREAAVLGLIVVIFLAVGALYATGVPPYNAPDEPAHFNYVRDLAERGTMPVLLPGDWDADLLERLKSTHFPPGSDVSTIRYESHQPPLYYVVVAPVARLAAGFGERRQLVAVRLATLVIGAAALVALHRVARVAIVCDPVTRLGVVALAAFIPMHVAVAASVSNDLTAELLLTLVLWRCLLALRDGLDDRRAALLGALVGLAMLAKVIDYAAVSLAALTILLAPTSRRLRRGTVAAGIACLLVAPWLLRGALVYGWRDPLGLGRHDEVVAGQPLTGAITADLIRDWSTTLLHSFWGQFGWMGVLLDERIYFWLGLLTAFVGVGVLLWVTPWGGFWRELDAGRRRAFVLAGLLVVAVAVETVGYNLTYLQPQGRYLFPAMAGIALWGASGLREVIAPRQRAVAFGALAVGLVVLDVVAFVRYVEPALRP